jgi:TonB family protein
MKLLLLFLLSVTTVNLSAQSWRYRNNGISKSDIERARITEENNRRVTRQNLQRYDQQERANQQRRETQQREYRQQQRRTENGFSTITQSADKSTQVNDKVVSLVVNGTGTTKEEATRNALRSAIEQAFGTFVSANTEILNDELIKDEIVTVTSGNIQSYEELSCSRKENGLFDISVKAVVSINKLVEFAQSKGAKTELAGSLFVNNIEIKEKNRENEDIALFNLRKQLMEICKKGLFDYNVVTSDPKYVNDNCYQVQVKVSVFINSNAVNFCEALSNTLINLSLSVEEQKEYERMNLRYCPIGNDFFRWSNIKGNSGYVLRNDYIFHLKIPELFESACKMFVVEDNIGNKISGDIIKDVNLRYKEIECRISGKPICQFVGEFKYTRDQMRTVRNINVTPLYTIPKSYCTLAYIDENSSSKGLSYSDGIRTEVLDQEAIFNGGKNALLSYLSKNVKYPVIAEENGIQGDVIVQFDVEKDGSVVDVKIVKSIDTSLDKEALRVVRNMPPRWKPAIKDGKPVRSRQTVTVPFRLGY